jgi:hypothetical protein
MDNSDGKGRVLEMEKPGMFAGLGGVENFHSPVDF